MIPALPGNKSPMRKLPRTGERIFKTPVTALKIPNTRTNVELFNEKGNFSVLLLLEKRTYPAKPLHKMDKKYNWIILLKYIKNTRKSIFFIADLFSFGVHSCHFEEQPEALRNHTE